MYDSGFYPIEAIKLLRAHWQKTAGKPDHKPRMKDAGANPDISEEIPPRRFRQGFSVHWRYLRIVGR
jgi:hypothetical protein